VRSIGRTCCENLNFKRGTSWLRSLTGIIVKEVEYRIFWERSPSDHRSRSCGDLTATRMRRLSTSRLRRRRSFSLVPPHRGSGSASMGETLRRVVSAVGFDTNDRNLRTLAFDSTELEMSREELIKMWRVRSLQVRTFQESQGLAGV
jgi:hypothetical protein